MTASVQVLLTLSSSVCEGVALKWLGMKGGRSVGLGDFLIFISLELCSLNCLNIANISKAFKTSENPRFTGFSSFHPE